MQTMLRKILAPLKDAPNFSSAPISSPKSRRYNTRGKENHNSSPTVHVSEPSDFRLIAHVECDPNTGLYKGIDEFMTLAVISRDRKSPVKSRSSSPPPLPLPPLRSFAEHRAQLSNEESSPSSSPDSSPIRLPNAQPPAPEAAELENPIPPSADKPPLAVQRRASPATKSQISRPSGVKHEVHVRVDLQNPTGFAGLPRAWETIFMYSGIMRYEAMANPEVVIDVLNFSKSTDPTVQATGDVRASLSKALPPIVLDRFATPSITSFDDAADDFYSSSDSYHAEISDDRTPPRRIRSSHVHPLDDTQPPFSESDERSCQESLPSPVPQSPSPQKEVETFVVNELDSDYMESFIGAERRQNLPDGIPEHLDASFREDDPLKLFTRMERIGEGSCGSVYRAIDGNGRFVALKNVKPENERDWKLYKFEVQVMQDRYNCDVLVQCYDAFRCKDELWIVMEYVSAGTLADLLCGRRKQEVGGSNSRGRASAKLAEPMDEGTIAYICREVLRGLDSLHSVRRVHRDIKGDNVLLDMDGSVKVADFGFCAELCRGSGKRNTVVGTPYWMAPEVIRGSHYDCKVDIWSTGVVAFECAEGGPPHIEASPLRAMFLIATQGVPSLSDCGRWSDELQDFIRRCCAVKAANRPTAREALAHAFIQKACDAADAAALFNEEWERRVRRRRTVLSRS